MTEGDFEQRLTMPIRVGVVECPQCGFELRVRIATFDAFINDPVYDDVGSAECPRCSVALMVWTEAEKKPGDVVPIKPKPPV